MFDSYEFHVLAERDSGFGEKGHHIPNRSMTSKEKSLKKGISSTN